MSSKVCFVIMPFSDQENPADNKWDDLFNNSIEPAVLGADLGYRCHRSIDTHGSFMSDIVHYLSTAEVVIAILTELRPNVMYELGVRNTLKRKTIMLVEAGSNISSNLSAYIALKYSTKTTAGREQLIKTIRKRLMVLDASEPDSDNPVYDYLSAQAVKISKEWYENMNPTVFRSRLNQVLPDYTRMLEAVVIGVRQGAVSIEERSAVQLTNKGMELKDEHRFEEALRFFDAALRLDPNDVSAWSNRALVLVQLNRFDEAVESAQKVVAFEATSPASWNALGKAFLLMKKFSESANAFGQAFKLDEKSAVYANNAGFALEASGKFEAAIAYYDKSIQLNPESKYALYNRGKVLQKLGREVEASAYIQKALKIDPWIGLEVDTQRRAFSLENEAT